MRMASAIATDPFDTRLDLFTRQGVHVARHVWERKVRRALLPFFKRENDFEVRKAPLGANRSNPIGSGCDAGIPAPPSRSVLEARMAKVRCELSECRYVHTIEQPVESPRSGRTGPAKAPRCRPHCQSSRNPRRPR
jgi:hypothetical protein